jgi:lipid II:glycine glycyltransferase (peptidoglycan interpeptide bridge formation enzyme)
MSAADWTCELLPFADASLYQTWQFGSVCWDESQICHIRIKRDGVTVALAQVRVIKLPLIPIGIAYVRWGPLIRRGDLDFDAGLFKAALEALKNEFCARRGLILRVVPNLYEMDSCANAAAQILRQSGFVQLKSQRSYHTIRIDLTQTVEDIRKGLRQRWRNKLKRAEGENFSVTIGTGDDRYARFQIAYDEMMSRKRFETTVSVPEFGRIQASLPEALKMRVLICEKEGILFNALVVAPCGDTGIYLLAATSDAGLSADGAFVLQWTAMKLLKELGCRWYDLGGINQASNPGVYQFKSGMGGVETAQLGTFQSSTSPLSPWIVSIAERLRARRNQGRSGSNHK